MRKFIILLFILGLTAASFGFYFYNKPRSGVSGLKPVEITDAKALFENYSADENASNTKYLGKVVEVYGIVKSVEKDKRGTMNVLLSVGDELSSVNCQFEKSDEMPEVEKGNSVLIKGICSGLLMDVVMVDCEMIKKN